MSSAQLTMTEETKKQLSSLLANIIEIKSHLIKHCTLWCIKGPSLGASAGITAIVQEEDGHVTILQRLRETEGLDKTQPTVTIPYLQELPRSWTHLILDIYIFDTFISRVIRTFKNSASITFSENVQKMIEEEYFHEQFSREWAALLAQSDNFKQEFSEEIMKALKSYDGLADKFDTDVLVRESLISEDIGSVYRKFREEIAAEFSIVKE